MQDIVPGVARKLMHNMCGGEDLSPKCSEQRGKRPSWLGRRDLFTAGRGCPTTAPPSGYGRQLPASRTNHLLGLAPRGQGGAIPARPSAVPRNFRPEEVCLTARLGDWGEPD